MFKRLWMAPLAFLLLSLPLRGATITSFVIINSNLTTFGGTFPGGGTYSGTFSFDTSAIPLSSAGALNLTSVNVVTTPQHVGANPLTDFGATYTLGQVFKVQTTIFNQPVDFVVVRLSSVGSALDLNFLEAPNSFVGGQIFSAIETSLVGSVIGQRMDRSGVTLALDPALVPEPASWTFCLAGGLAIAVAKTRSRRTRRRL